MTDSAGTTGRNATTDDGPRRFTASDGIDIAYRTWGDVGDQPPVVLHHGFVADGNLNWAAPGIVQALVDAGRFVVAIDARGHGASDKPHDQARYGERRMADDLAELYDLIGADRVDLVGYSMGAIVSVISASSDERIRRLVIGGVGSSVVELGGVDTRHLDNVALAAALRADDPATITDPVVRDFRAFTDATGADRLALAAHAEAVHHEPIPLKRITAPTLLLIGDADPLADGAEVLVDAIPDARVERFEGDHLSVVADPGFARAIVEFLT